MRAVPDPNVLSAAPWLKSAKEMCPANSSTVRLESARNFISPGNGAIDGGKREAANDSGFRVFARVTRSNGLHTGSPTVRRPECRGWSYFSCVEMLVKLVLRVEPIVFTVAMITTEMPAAIKPYSIAVAPESSFRKARTFDI